MASPKWAYSLQYCFCAQCVVRRQGHTGLPYHWTHFVAMWENCTLYPHVQFWHHYASLNSRHQMKEPGCRDLLPWQRSDTNVHLHASQYFLIETFKKRTKERKNFFFFNLISKAWGSQIKMYYFKKTTKVNLLKRTSGPTLRTKEENLKYIFLLSVYCSTNFSFLDWDCKRSLQKSKYCNVGEEYDEKNFSYKPLQHKATNPTTCQSLPSSGHWGDDTNCFFLFFISFNFLTFLEAVEVYIDQWFRYMPYVHVLMLFIYI